MHMQRLFTRATWTLSMVMHMFTASHTHAITLLISLCVQDTVNLRLAWGNFRPYMQGTSAKQKYLGIFIQEFSPVQFQANLN